MQLFSPLASDYPQPASEFERQVFDFCQKWKDGQSHFEFMTSGSTGLPKPILISREAIIASANMTGQWLELKPNDLALLCLPVNYIAGAMVLVRALVFKLNLILVDPSVNPLKDLAPISIQLASFVPNQWYTLLKEGVDLNNYFVNSKGVLLGGAGLSPWLLDQTSAMQFPVYLTYGMTETVSHVAFRSLSLQQTNCFELLPSIEFKVNANSCACFKGDVTNSKWVETNDIVERIDVNHFILLGRADRVINSAGRKIQAEQVEQKLGVLITDRSFFVSSLPDESLGQKAVLFVEGLELIDEQRFRLTSLESWEIPKQVVYLPKFETTASGKMDRLKSVALYLNAQK